MTLDEVIKRFEHNAEFERRNGNLQGCLEFRQLVEWLSALQEYKDVLNKIRVEITENIETYRMSDWETNNVLADGLQMALNIIDGYREGEQE